MSRPALLFDLDGTLLDTDPLHHKAFVSVFAERGRGLDIEEYKTRIIGKPNAQIMAEYFPGEETRHAEIAEIKESRFRDLLGGRADPTAGIHALLDWAERERIGTAVVTNAPRVNAEAMLAAAGLAERLTLLLIGEECPRPKPDPLPYRMAMEALGATPARSVAFEDSPSGLRAARAAGAHVFGLTSSLSPETLRGAGAHEIIDDFTAPALWSYLDALVARDA
ncbi:HAD family hydrolase [Amaricoccus solimangrovi]|uniref:HAD-IA family hydrolase n=1 Tax=Amaricoccus solimangrovi TaxID=2589815 RepID=A0A501WLA4_9RHOB|nr:HAD-IA family hydrolase [Amaricoccus solimangrovi]TPE50138.1 HAD-IA family hydrolase [Amaricoccus solimangrovi]